MDNILKLIKEEVKWVKLGEVSQFINGYAFKANLFREKGSPIIKITNIQNGAINFNDCKYINLNDYKNLENFLIKKGDILIAMSGATVGKIGYNFKEKEAYLNQRVGKIVPNENILNNKYLYYYLRFKEKTIVNLTNSTGAQPNLNKSDIEKLMIPIPSLETQRKIVDILDRYTKSYEELKECLAKEKDLRIKQYEYYREKLLSEEYLIKKTKELCGKDAIVLTKTLGEIGKIKMCKRILKDQTSPIGDIPFYKIGTFGKKADSFISRDLFLEYKEKYNYPKTGEILISASGTIGRTVIFNGEDSYFQDSNIVWISHDEKEVLNKYLYHFYKIVKWNISEGGTIQRLYSYNLEKTKILIPPLQVQTHISSILYKYTSSYLQLQSTLSKEIEFRTKQYEYYRELLLNF